MTDHLPEGKLPDSIASIIEDMPLVISKISAGQLMNLAREEGYSCSLDEDGDLLWKMDGYTTYLFISKSGRIITFQTGFQCGDEDEAALLQRINQWHRGIRFARTYYEKRPENADLLKLELDIDLTGGVTKERLIDFLITCRDMFGKWRAEVLDRLSIFCCKKKVSLLLRRLAFLSGTRPHDAGAVHSG